MHITVIEFTLIIFAGHIDVVSEYKISAPEGIGVVDSVGQLVPAQHVVGRAQYLCDDKHGNIYRLKADCVAGSNLDRHY